MSLGVLSSQTGQFWLKSTALQAGLWEVRARLSRQATDTMKSVRVMVSKSRLSGKNLQSVFLCLKMSCVPHPRKGILRMSQNSLVFYDTNPTFGIHDDLSQIELRSHIRHRDHQIATPGWLGVVAWQLHDEDRCAGILVTDLQVWHHWLLIWKIGEVRRVCHS